MQLSTKILDQLAVCFDYPRSDLPTVARSAAQALRVGPDDTSELESDLEALASWWESVGGEAAEERYTQLFDLKPVATLNLSHHLLGDTYQRGALLSGLASELNAQGIAHQHDLPDFLPTLLKLLGRLPNEEDRRVLVHSVVIPGLKKVATKLEPSPGPYPVLLRRLLQLLPEGVPLGDGKVPRLRKPLEVLSC